MKDTSDGRRQEGAGGHGRGFVGGTPGSRPGRSCSFCWFVLSVYPDLVGLAWRDEATFKEHLKESHGLAESIPC